MKIIINGAGGRMGRALRNMAQEKNIEVAAMVDAFVEEPGMLKKLADFDGQADCIIDFSHHSGVGDLLAYGIAIPLMEWVLSGTSDVLRDNLTKVAGMCLFTGFNYLGQRLFAFREKAK